MKAAGMGTMLKIVPYWGWDGDGDDRCGDGRECGQVFVPVQLSSRDASSCKI